jgi:hypothetical protein
MKTLIASALAAASLFGSACAQTDSDPRLTALLAVHRQDLMSAAMVQYCQAHAPNQAPALKASWQAWRERQSLDLVAMRLQRWAPQALGGLNATQLGRLQARMERAGPPAALCADLQSGWSGSGTDLRSRYPQAFAPEPNPADPVVMMAAP